MTIPNLITSIRIILTPIFIIYLINDELILALLLFVLAGISDGLDGFIARCFDQKSKLGAFLDPLADKILLISAFVALSIKGHIYPWLTVTVISRDILILLGVLIMFLNSQDFSIKPSFLSKMTTCLQLVSIFAVLSESYLPFFSGVKDGLFWTTGFLTIVSGLQYMHRWFQMIGKGPIHD